MSPGQARLYASDSALRVLMFTATNPKVVPLITGSHRRSEEAETIYGGDLSLPVSDKLWSDQLQTFA